MTGPTDFAKSLLWINEAQNHVNSCASEFADPEALEAAEALQHWIDDEWDTLKTRIAKASRPYSVLRSRSS